MNKNSKRKLDHIKSCVQEDVESQGKGTGFEDINLIHQALPEVDFDSIDLSAKFLDKKLDVPLMISPMTGGHERSKELNRNLATAAESHNIAFSVGSQRVAIETGEFIETYQVRDVAPDILLFGNLGVTQLIQGYGVEEVEDAIDMIDADGIGIHLNPLQEVVQPEGSRDFRDAFENISKIASELDEFVYVKETGSGMDSEVASKLEECDVDAIDVSGVGGTSWAGVEATRDSSRKKAGNVFWDWGIPTSVSTAEVCRTVDIPVISSGGIRTGLEAAKAFALGADLVSVGLPLFRASLDSEEKVIEWLDEFILELKMAMFLTGIERVSGFEEVSCSVFGETRERFKSRDLFLEKWEGDHVD